MSEARLQRLTKRINELESIVAVLTDSKQVLDAITNTAEDSIFIKDIHFRYTFINPAMERTLGLPASELIGKTPEELFGKEEAKIIASVDRPVFKGKIVNAKRTLKINGIERVFHTVQTPVLDSDGNVKAICGIVRDVTDLKRTEEALRESEEKLRSYNEELRVERQALHQKNIALQEVLSQIESGKEQLASQIKSNIDRVVMPIIKGLADKSSNETLGYITLLESSLKDVTSPFISHLESDYSCLTSRQIEICNMVRSGMSCKEISTSLNISVQTVLKQRTLIRKNLGISNKKINLASYLQSMS
ncbi:MAG: PAS domain S-box protein [candidate division Zixibacteria bacterium]|nr:PAS domain S-box protein [candidate division Zixibacteria bacterium]